MGCGVPISMEGSNDKFVLCLGHCPGRTCKFQRDVAAFLGVFSPFERPSVKIGEIAKARKDIGKCSLSGGLAGTATLLVACLVSCTALWVAYLYLSG